MTKVFEKFFTDTSQSRWLPQETKRWLPKSTAFRRDHEMCKHFIRKALKKRNSGDSEAGRVILQYWIEEYKKCSYLP